MQSLAKQFHTEESCKIDSSQYSRGNYYLKGFGAMFLSNLSKALTNNNDPSFDSLSFSRESRPCLAMYVSLRSSLHSRLHTASGGIGYFPASKLRPRSIKMLNWNSRGQPEVSDGLPITDKKPRKQRPLVNVSYEGGKLAILREV